MIDRGNKARFRIFDRLALLLAMIVELLDFYLKLIKYSFILSYFLKSFYLISSDRRLKLEICNILENLYS